MDRCRWTVFLHALEGDAAAPRLSVDIDAAVDVRVDPRALRRMVGVLEELGFVAAGESPEGLAPRFVKSTESGSASFDVLVPEGLGERADRRTVGAATAFEASGVTQALARTQLVPIRHRGSLAWVPRPDILGALVVKAVAVDVDPIDSERHRLDLAFLCGLVADPFELAQLTTPKDRQRLRRAERKLPGNDPAWNAAADPDDAHAALAILSSED